MTDREFRPDWASAPGDTIRDILLERELSVSDFANRLCQTQNETEDLLYGRSSITIEIARRLARTLGASVEFWMSRDYQYRQDVAKLHETEKYWLDQLPLSDMIKFGWLSPVPYPSEELDSCLQFFDVASIAAWHERYAKFEEMALFRTSASFDSRPAAVAAWLRQGEILGDAIQCKPWNAKSFEQALLDLRHLTKKKDPQLFLPAIQEHCASSGVAVAIVRAPTGCRASGATRFLSRNKALLMLSFRYLTDDHFWFTFFHEAGHLLIHGDRGLFLETTDTPSSIEEKEANDFAARILVPDQFQSELLKLAPNSREIIRFARKIGASPGIVVGQLQHCGKIKHSQLNSLKRRFSWID